MEPSLCKLRRKPVKNLMPLPPYCWKAQVVREEDDAIKANRLEVSDPGRILLLIEALFDNNTLELEKKLNFYIKTEAEAETSFLITLVSLSEEAVIQVVGQNELQLECRTPSCCQLLKHIVKKKTTVFHTPSEFDEDMQVVLRQHIPGMNDETEFVTIPFVSKLKRGKSFAVPLLISIVNSKKTPEFLEKLINELARFCLPLIMNTSKLEEEAKIKRQCQSLLHVARRLFSHLGDLNDLLKEIMSEARRLTNSERCSLFLLDPDHIHLVAKVFDGVVHENVTTEVRIAKDQGIAGHVAATGKLLNIKDAYQHPLFYKGMDEATGFKTRNILCFPIRDEQGIVGVAQLCNKLHGDFDFFDEEVALAFSIYCGVSIMHSLVYKKMKEAQNRSQLSNELMLYHMKVSTDDVTKILLCTNRHAYLDFDTFGFPPKRVHVPETPCQILRIFEDLNFFEHFRIKRDILARFVLYAQKGYRDTPYHNWMHAFSVTHFAYVAIKQLELLDKGYLTHLEALAYLISCMCHDIDHRGTTNSFQLQSQSLLACLYSSEGSVMEHHHLSQTMCILNTEDCNFLECLRNDDYIKCLDLIKNMILATDLANHFKLMEMQQTMIEKGYNPEDEEDRYVFICLLMTCADLSDQIKGWEAAKAVAQQIYNEFFSQGDLEKSMGKKPVAMMDREKASIPNLQIDFLYEVILPVYTTLEQLFPDVYNFVSNIKRNIICWEACKPVFEKFAKQKKGGLTSLEVLTSDELDLEVQKIISMEKSKELAAGNEEDEGEEEEEDEEGGDKQKEEKKPQQEVVEEEDAAD